MAGGGGGGYSASNSSATQTGAVGGNQGINLSFGAAPGAAPVIAQGWNLVLVAGAVLLLFLAALYVAVKKRA